MCWVVPSEAYTRKCPAVPVASAEVSAHVPDLAFDPDAAAAIQSLGRVSVARTVPESASTMLVGGAPVLIFNTAGVLIAVSIASSRAFLTATDILIAIQFSFISLL